MASAAAFSTAAHRGESSIRAGSALRWPFEPWGIPAWWLGWAFGWWRASVRTLEHTATLAPGFAEAVPFGAALAVATRLVVLLAETGFYAAFWRTRRAPLPYWRYAFHLVLGSLLDLQAIELARLRPAGDVVAPWLVVLAGPAALPASFAHAHPVLSGAFAGLGLLTLGRIVWVAWAQACATRRPLLGPLALTAALWLVTHGAIAAGLALAQGRSVAP